LALVARAGEWVPARNGGLSHAEDGIQVRVVSADSERIELAYRMLAPGVTRRADGAALLEVPGLFSEPRAPGAPLLPTLLAYVALPLNRACERMELTVEEWSSLAGPLSVAHQDLLQRPVSEGPQACGPDPSIYGRDDLWPSEPFEPGETRYRRGWPFAFGRVNLVRVRPASGRVEYAAAFRLTVTLTPAAGSELPPQPDEADLALYDNPEQVGVAAAPAPTQAGRVGALAVTPPLIGGITAGRGPYDYVIITSTNLNAVGGEYGLERLRLRRAADGLSAVIVTVQEIYPVYPGRDNAEKVRNFLRDAYVTWGARFVLLAGDTAYVPHRNFYLNGGADYFPADMYYANLDGDFDANGNSRFGEIFAGDNDVATNKIDLAAELAVGRFSGESAYEIQTAVYKTLAYEDLPVNAGVHNRALIWTDIYAELGNRITSSTTTPGFSSDDPETNGARIWYAAQDPIWKRMNSGQWGFFSHGGHGGPGGIAYFDEGSCNSLANAPGFFYCTTIGCLTGKFDEHCLPEYLTTHNRGGGAFAAVMNSNLGYAGPINAAVDYEFEIPFGSGVTEVGRIAAIERERLAANSSDWYYMWTCYERNLFGDPAAKWRALYALGLGARYAFDGDARDLSGNGSNGELRNGPVFVTGRWGQALRFDGANDYVACSTPYAFPAIQHEVSLSAWVRPESLKDNMGIVHKGDNTHQAYSFGLHADGKPYFKANRKTGGTIECAESSGVWTGAVAVATGVWTHVAVTLKHDYEIKYTATNNVLPERVSRATLTFYVNGVAGTPLYLDNLLLGRTREALCLGANMLSGERAYFHGTLDEVRIWGRDLTANEVKQEMQRGLVARYALEGNANDSGPFAKNGIREGGTAFVSDRSGQVLFFDGTNSQVRISESGTPDPLDIRRRLTLAAWVRPDSLRENAGLITKGTNGVPFAFVLGADGRLALRANQGAGLAFAAGGGAWTSSLAVAAGAWSHVAVRYDGREVAFFVNGRKDSLTGRTDLVFGRNNEPLFLGAAYAGGSGRFHGRLDEAQLFAFPLQDEEITRLAYSEVAALAAPEITLLPPRLATTASATVEGRVSGASGGTATLYYGPADAGFAPGGWSGSASAAVSADGTFAVEASGLAAGSRNIGRIYFESGATRGWSAETAVFGPAATAGWTRRLLIRLPMSDAAFTNRLSDFPALVQLGPAISGFRYADFASPATGADLRFTDEAGALLDYEIDEWDTNGTSLVWVSVPALRPDTLIQAWWGKSGAAAPSAASQAAVWQRIGAQGVWHLKESGVTSGSKIYKDSSGNGRTGADYVAASGKFGKVGKGQKYGSGDGITYSASGSADNSFTLSFWCRPTAARTALSESVGSIVDDSGQRFVVYPVHGGENAGVGLSVGTNGLTVIEHGGNYRPALYTLNTTLSTSSWTHIALAYDGKQPRLYLNGVRQGNGGLQSARPGWSRLSGYAGYNGSSGFQGDLDELAVQQGAWPESWLKALYQSQSSPTAFAVCGAVSAVDGTSVVAPDRALDERVPFSALLYSTNAANLAYALLDGPSGLTLGATGLVSWTASEVQGPGVYTVTFRATNATASVTQSFSLTVREVNNYAPVLSALGQQVVDEQATLSVQLPAPNADADVPPDAVASYALVSGPTGLAVSASGLITWTPAEEQGPATNLLTYRVLDSGSPALAATQQVSVAVREVNAAPALAAVPDAFVEAGATFSHALAASDPDLPANTFSYALVDAPAGAAVSPAGLITWTPADEQVNRTHPFVARVTDSGAPPLAAEIAFNVSVGNRPPQLTWVRPAAGAALPASTVALLEVQASDSDGVATVDFLADGASLGRAAASVGGLFRFAWLAPLAGTHELTAVAADAVGMTAYASRSITCVTSLPPPWKSVDLGAPLSAGSAGFAEGVFSAVGCGAVATNGTGADQCQLVWHPAPGDGSLVARVLWPGTAPGGSWAGVCVRESTNSAAARGLFLGLTAEGRTLAAARASGAGPASSIATVAPPGPLWLRVERSDSATNTVLRGSFSADGTNWTLVATATCVGLWPTNAVAGLFVASPSGAPACAAFEQAGLWGMAARYRFDDAPETRVAIDSGGRCRHATFERLSASDPYCARSGGVLGCATNAWISTPVTNDLAARTLAAWIRPAASPDVSNFEGVIDSDRAGSYGAGFGLDNGFYKAILNNQFWDTGVPVTLGAWQHAALTFTASEARLYTNGLLAASLAYVRATPAGTNNFYIGRSRANPLYFRGSLDDALIFDRALGSNEVAGLVLTTGVGCRDTRPATGSGGTDSGLAVAGELLVDLHARRGAAAGGAGVTNWINFGTLAGVFTNQTVAKPTLATVTGQVAISFASAALISTARTPVGLVSNGAWSVEAWVFNPTVENEEGYFAWAPRGGPNYTTAGLLYGTNSQWGAANHWGAGGDMGWDGGVPAAGRWHHLVATYDGLTERLYADGTLSASENKTLLLPWNKPFSVGATYEASLAAAKLSTLSLAGVRMHSGVLTPGQIAANVAAGPDACAAIRLAAPSAAALSPTSASLSCTVTSDGDQPLTAWGTAWGTAPAPTAGGAMWSGSTNAPFVIAEARAALVPGSLVYARAWASNALFGAVWSADIRVQLPPLAVTNLRAQASDAGGATFRWTRGSGSTNTLLVLREADEPAAPAHGTAYVAASAFGAGAALGPGSYAVYAGTGVVATVTGLATGRTYRAAAYAWSGAGAELRYAAAEVSSRTAVRVQPDARDAAQDLLIDLHAARGVESDAAGRVVRWVNFGSAGGVYTTALAQAAGPRLTAEADGRPALAFDGVADALRASFLTPLSVTGKDAANRGEDFTVEAWVCNVSVANEEVLFAWGHGASGSGQRCAQMNYGTNAGFGAASHWGTNLGFAGGAAPASNVWHHLALTYDGAVERIYVDGALNNQVNNSLNIYTNEPSTVGARYSSATASTVDSFFSGRLAALRVHAGCLPADRVAAAWAAGADAGAGLFARAPQRGAIDANSASL
jgi:hypothetical protein